jgi:hypothetical protein
MRHLFLYLFLLLQINLFAQNCLIDPFISENYEYDAELLTVHEIQTDSNHLFRDSVFIPYELKNKYLMILTSVYHNENINLTDTLFNQYKIHVTGESSEISMQVDPNIKWVKTLITDSVYSGNPEVDSILTKYSFKLESTMNLGSQLYLFIKSPHTLNLLPVIDQLQKIDGILFAEFFGYPVFIVPIDCSDELPNDIFCSGIGEFYYLTFQKRMGACPDNCFKSRYWKFQIQNECDITFSESYCQSYDGIKMNTISKQIAFPNPFIDNIQISEAFSNSNPVIYNLAGDIVYKGYKISDHINLGYLENGNYIITVEKGSTTFMQKLMKKKRD